MAKWTTPLQWWVSQVVQIASAEGSFEKSDAFGEALDDDLNISAALAVVFDLIRTTNRRMDESSVTPSEALSLLNWLAGESVS